MYNIIEDVYFYHTFSRFPYILRPGIFYIVRLHRIDLRCVTSGAGTANPCDAPEFTPGF